MSLPHFSKSWFWNVGQIEDLANGLVISSLFSPASSLDFLNMKLRESAELQMGPAAFFLLRSFFLLPRFTLC